MSCLMNVYRDGGYVSVGEIEYCSIICVGNLPDNSY